MKKIFLFILISLCGFSYNAYSKETNIKALEEAAINGDLESQALLGERYYFNKLKNKEKITMKLLSGTL